MQIKSELLEKDLTSKKLASDLKEATEDLINYKMQIANEKEEIEAKQEAEVLKRVADRDYFDEGDVLDDASEANHTVSTGGGSNRARGGLLSGLFNRSTHDFPSEGESDGNWETKAREKDMRIAHLEKELADNNLSISNLKNELVTASSKFKEDEGQRRLLIQRLENENQAYSIKLEVLESEFEDIRKRKEAVAAAKSNNRSTTLTVNDEDGSVGSSVHQSGYDTSSSSVLSDSGSSMTGVSAITGASCLTPLERDNKKLKKQKKVYENRIASLQIQLSEIQQIVPELMSKSKSQIQKLEIVIETQRQEAEEREQKLSNDIEDLRQQNQQLQAATRSRLQSSGVDRQEEIDQLKMRLEAREATIKKLEMLSTSSKLRKKGNKILRKKPKKKDTNHGDSVSVLSGTSSAWDDGQSVTYSVTTDTVFSAM